MKEAIKKVLADVSYFFHRIPMFRTKIDVASMDETIDELINTDKSLVRFGDGEIIMLRGKKTATQKYNEKLRDDLIRVLKTDDDKLMITYQDIFNSLSYMVPQARRFWKDHLLVFRKVYKKYSKKNKKYYNTEFSRAYYVFKDKSRCGEWFEKIRSIWKDKDLVVVEGYASHNGVTNNLLDSARSIERILCPSHNAYDSLPEIKKACLEEPKDKLFLISLGAAAKPLVLDLFEQGYRAIDIGNLDMEYEWFLEKADGKGSKHPKRDIIGLDANREAGFDKYISEVAKSIGTCE